MYISSSRFVIGVTTGAAWGFFYITNIQKTKLSSTHGACAFLFQPHLTLVITLPSRKPTGQALHTPHRTTITIAAAIIRRQQLSISIGVRTLFVYFYIGLGHHASKALLCYTISFIDGIQTNLLLEDINETIDYVSMKLYIGRNNNRTRYAFFEISKFQCIDTNVKIRDSSAICFHHYADHLQGIICILRHIICFCL